MGEQDKLLFSIFLLVHISPMSSYFIGNYELFFSLTLVQIWFLKTKMWKEKELWQWQLWVAEAQGNERYFSKYLRNCRCCSADGWGVHSWTAAAGRTQMQAGAGGSFGTAGPISLTGLPASTPIMLICLCNSVAWWRCYNQGLLAPEPKPFSHCYLGFATPHKLFILAGL
jgi:hypothetical protein